MRYLTTAHGLETANDVGCRWGKAFRRLLSFTLLIDIEGGTQPTGILTDQAFGLRPMTYRSLEG